MNETSPPDRGDTEALRQRTVEHPVFTAIRDIQKLRILSIDARIRLWSGLLASLGTQWQARVNKLGRMT
jgi:hypothetical protein